MPEGEEVDTALWAGIQDGSHLPFQHLARAAAPTEQLYKNEPTVQRNKKSTSNISAVIQYFLKNCK
jgi:hypothetical protein